MALSLCATVLLGSIVAVLLKGSVRFGSVLACTLFGFTSPRPAWPRPSATASPHSPD